jgi:hypothetical protein
MLGVLAVVTAALITQPGTADAVSPNATVPSAVTIAEQMAERPDVFMANPVDEGPDTVVRGGFCTRVAELGCRQMVGTKDASVMVFDSTKQARDYTGAADDTAKAYGRMVLSFGSPARVAAKSQGAYRKAMRSYRRTHRAAMPDAVRAAMYLASRGLPMRDAHLEDEGGVRRGRASEIAGAIDMAITDQASIIVFAVPAAAADYVRHADDNAYRQGRVVLSFGSPARVVKASQPTYERALRAVLG